MRQSRRELRKARPRDRSKPRYPALHPVQADLKGLGHRPARRPRRSCCSVAPWADSLSRASACSIQSATEIEQGGAPGRVRGLEAVAASGSKSTLARWRVTLAILARAASRSPWRAAPLDLRRSAAALLDDRGRDPFVQAQARAPSGSFRRLAGLEIEACQGVTSHAALKDRIRRQEDPAATVRRFRTIANQQREPGLRTDGAAFCERGKAVKAS